MDSVVQIEVDPYQDSIRPLSDASPVDLARARRNCAELAKLAAGNFYYAFIFMPAVQRFGIEALYAFCRAGDDVVDAPGTSPENAEGSNAENKLNMLTRLRRRLDLCYQGFYVDDLTLSLSDALGRFRFERDHFDDLMTGIETDITVKRYPTFGDLRLYCYRVASTIGLLCLKIFGCDTSQSRQYAENLGIGMQLTNILRDIREDLDRDRIYLPGEDLERFGIDESELFIPANSDRLVKLVRWEAERAESFFQQADSCLEPGMNRTLFPARIMGSIYRAILDRIKSMNRFDSRVELSKSAKLTIARRIAVEVLS